jgi:hypothetical protein
MTQRTHADGFWVVLENDELWFVGPRGAAWKEGTFAPLPSGVIKDLSRERALDFWGALYQTAGFKNGRVVVKRPLLPARSRIVYTDVDVPRNDWSRTPPRLHLWIRESFVTGP